MEKEIELRSEDFKRELKIMIKNSRKCSDSTIDKKVGELFKKYDKLILRAPWLKDQYKSNYEEQVRDNKILKTGFFEGYQSEGKITTLYSIKEISKFEVNEKSIIITFKNGETVNFAKDFIFLKQFLNTTI